MKKPMSDWAADTERPCSLNVILPDDNSPVAAPGRLCQTEQGAELCVGEQGDARERGVPADPSTVFVEISKAMRYSVYHEQDAQLLHATLRAGGTSRKSQVCGICRCWRKGESIQSSAQTEKRKKIGEEGETTCAAIETCLSGFCNALSRPSGLSADIHPKV
ncbi:melatonin receptor type 1B [Platysternon megacephalum]|uniref:Melatonin receptor type 1B n=1 Tax=Platysternon megacephalum TaxID=55544 RepID=A0A4D9ED90_9SAUR|nr:melatonin receptor type 1B [Platysternon megacephalum]